MSTHPLLESAPSTLLEARSNSSNLSTADDEEQQQESNDEGASEGEEEDDFINLPIKKFIPDYERISYGYDAVNKNLKERMMVVLMTSLAIDLFTQEPKKSSRK